MSAARSYTAFCFHFGLPDFPAQVEVLLAFAEFSLRDLRSPASLRNLLGALKTIHLLQRWDTSAFTDHKVNSYLLAVDHTVRHIPQQKPPLTLPLLLKITSDPPLPPTVQVIFKALLSLLFHTFLRLSSVLPTKPSQYDNTRHLSIADLFEADPGLVLLVKWGKCHQRASQAYTVPIHPAPGSPFCPVSALSALLGLYHQKSPTQPLFCLPPFNRSHRPLPLTSTTAHRWLRLALLHEGLDPSLYTFHSIRRGGSSAAFLGSYL